MGRRRLDPLDVKRRRVLYVSDRDWPAVARAIDAAATSEIRCSECGVPKLPDGMTRGQCVCGIWVVRVRGHIQRA